MQHGPTFHRLVNTSALLIAVACLAGCGLGAGIASTYRQVIGTESAQRNIQVNLSGGKDLNPSVRRIPSPVEVCLYLVLEPDWLPEPQQFDSKCATARSNGDQVLSERRIVAPNRTETLVIKAPGNRDSWLVIDADFRTRSAKAEPLRVATKRTRNSVENVLLDEQQITRSKASAP
ncbi:type VI secretion lipoprotein TssJ [Paraburkholderia susongensis]|uniref:Type VI secretion lipoprotein, VasD, EvfM, TssJ, VC_A0113 n=1 Tax=Paraburkholderia susongensis TaxID=1515439 RepID=A0A1X7M4I3_9BURK|nr:type VI secretion lipoprotein TssJ [Paraburkholderia susongensis]SMG61106.1 Type VI secretion lipoprotein, VasD, EvfM, TssJ, VC_A0113 [Paraburkholderia susongensis]